MGQMVPLWAQLDQIWQNWNIDKLLSKDILKGAQLKNLFLTTRVFDKNTIRDGGSTALYACYTVDTLDTVDIVYTVDKVYTVDLVCIVDMVYFVDIVYTVDIVGTVYTVHSIQTTLHCLNINSNMYAYVYC